MSSFFYFPSPSRMLTNIDLHMSSVASLSTVTCLFCTKFRCLITCLCLFSAIHANLMFILWLKLLLTCFVLVSNFKLWSYIQDGTQENCLYILSYTQELCNENIVYFVKIMCAKENSCKRMSKLVTCYGNRIQ